MFIRINDQSVEAFIVNHEIVRNLFKEGYLFIMFFIFLRQVLDLFLGSWFSAFCFSAFLLLLFLLFAFPDSLLFMLLCFSALPASFLFCFSAFLLLCFCAFLILLFYFFFSFALYSLLFVT